MGWASEEKDDCFARVWCSGWHAWIHKSSWRSEQWEVEGMEEDSRCLSCNVECFALYYPQGVLCEAPHEEREAKVCLWVPREITWGAAFPSELLEDEEELQRFGWFRKVQDSKIWFAWVWKDWTYKLGKRLSFALLDLWHTLRHSVLEDHVKNPHFSLLLAMLRSMKNPSISKPAMWL